MPSVEIRRLHLQRFRAFENVIWHPRSGMNVILGGGDVGKTTILDAVALLLTPSNSYVVSDSDYWRREVESEFSIEAVLWLPDESEIRRQGPLAWPWEWDSGRKEAVLPSAEPGDATRDAVYRVRVRGTSDLELVHELVQPDDNAVSFSTALRRSVGLVRLAGDDRSDRDIRLVQGGALDRLLADKNLRARLARKMASQDVGSEVGPEARKRLATLDASFVEAALPSELDVGFVGGAGVSVNSLVGLTAKKNGTTYPLASWGAGTRRLAALTVHEALTTDRPITVVDELERGLEPYRQRGLVSDLMGRDTQILLTTHSSAVLGAAEGATLWHIDTAGTIGEIPASKTRNHRTKDPEAFLARLTIVAEGATEVGFLYELLGWFVAPNWRDMGIYVTDGGGNESVLSLLEALASGGLKFAGFADRERENPKDTKWAALRQQLGPLLLRWPSGCLESNIIPFFGPSNLESVTEDPEGRWTGMRKKTLADRLGITDTTWSAIFEKAGDKLVTTIIEAATGAVPEGITIDKERKIYKGHGSVWFKSVEGGREFAEKASRLGALAKAMPTLRPFLNGLRASVGLQPLGNLGE